MAGLFDLWSDDPRGQAELALMSGLLAGRGNLGGILGRSIAGGQEAYNQGAALQSQLQGRKTAEEMQRANLAMERERLDLAKMPKPGEGFALSPGQRRFDASGREIASAPAVDPQEKPTQLAQLIAERDKLPQGHPLRKAYDDAILKQTTHQPAVSVSYGAPISAVNPNTGKVEFFRPDNRGGMTPTGIKPPPTDRDIRPTEGQSNAALYASRMEQSDKIINDLEGKYSRVQLAARQSAGQGVIGSVANAMVGSDVQKADQAQRDFINAVLRRESGAVIADQEFANARLQYFPQPGDSIEVVRQKAANRRTAIQGIKNAAGAALKPTESTTEAPSGNVIDWNSLK